MESEKRDREHVLREAGRIFCLAGYDALYFNRLAWEMRCAQATLYHDFRDRKTLLTEILRTYGYRHFHKATSVLLKPDVCTIKRRLMRFAVQALMILREEEFVLGIFRRTLSDLRSRGLTELLYAAGLRQVQEMLTDVIDTAMQRREIRFADPALLACQYFSLINNIIEINLLLNGNRHISLCLIRTLARDSVDLFLHGAQTVNSKKGSPGAIVLHDFFICSDRADPEAFLSSFSGNK